MRCNLPGTCLATTLQDIKLQEKLHRVTLASRPCHTIQHVIKMLNQDLFAG